MEILLVRCSTGKIPVRQGIILAHQAVISRCKKAEYVFSGEKRGAMKMAFSAVPFIPCASSREGASGLVRG
jgi:hypothetical protein